MDFHLHPQLARDTLPITRVADCQLLLMNDRRWLWCVLVPEAAGLRELHDLPDETRGQVLKFACQLSAALQHEFAADKMNLAALGNQVPQLHLHVIARHVGDAAWPAPVWGHGPPIPWTLQERAEMLARLRTLVAGLDPGPVTDPSSGPEGP